MDEIWKDVVGYEGIYQISNLGKVKRLGGTPRTLKDRVHKSKFLSDGRARVCLCANGRYKFTFAYRLMAQAFIPNPLNKPYVDHIDRDKTNNKLENLRWVTNAENVANSRRQKDHPKGVRKTKANTYQAYGSTYLGGGKNRFVSLGHYATSEEAAAVVFKFKQAKYGDFYAT